MKLLLTLIIALFAFILVSCGEKAKEMKDALELAQKAPEMAKNMQSAQDASKVRWEERKKKGDTLSLPFKKLEEFIPPTISGYKSEEPAGQNMNMQGLSYSESSRRYVKENATGAAEDIEIKLVDYNATQDLFSAAFFWMSTNFSREDANGYERTIDIGVKEVPGFEKYTKSSKTAELTFAVGYRFILTIRVENQANTDFAKSIAKSMRLADLAKM